MPDTKQAITDGFNQSIAKPLEAAQTQAKEQFMQWQNDYAYQVTHAFSTRSTADIPYFCGHDAHGVGASLCAQRKAAP